LILEGLQSDITDLRYVSLVLCKVVLKTCWPRLRGSVLATKLVAQISVHTQNPELKNEAENVKTMLNCLLWYIANQVLI